jgi:hypothetical protein
MKVLKPERTQGMGREDQQLPKAEQYFHQLSESQDHVEGDQSREKHGCALSGCLEKVWREASAHSPNCIHLREQLFFLGLGPR